MANSIMVSYSNINNGQTSCGISPMPKSFAASSISRQEAPITQEDNSSCLSVVRQKLINQGLSPAAIEIVMSSWRQGTKSQYQSSLQKWTDFCKKHNIDIFEPSIPGVRSHQAFKHPSPNPWFANWLLKYFRHSQT